MYLDSASSLAPHFEQFGLDGGDGGGVELGELTEAILLKISVVDGRNLRVKAVIGLVWKRW